MYSKPASNKDLWKDLGAKTNTIKNVQYIMYVAELFHQILEV